MSTLAVWLFAALGFLFVVTIVVIIAAGLAVVRKAKALAGEMNDLLGELDTAVGSVSSGSPDVPARRAGGTDPPTTYSGYHGRESTRQEEVDHG